MKSTFLTPTKVSLAIFGLVCAALAAIPAVHALENAPNAEAQHDETFWCHMRGRPCELVDHDAAGECPDCGMKLVTKTAYLERIAKIEANQKVLGVILYPGFELLDVFGPVEMWAYVPNLKVVLIAEKAGRVNSTQGVPTIAEYSFDTCPDLDILMVPGGMGTLRQVNNEAILDFVRERHETAEITTSVCTGSWILAKAGVLDGHKATSNKLYFNQTTQQSPNVEWIAKARWVDDGKVITSSGVSAGMDMALHLIERLNGAEQADRIASLTEYVWNRDPQNDQFAKE